MSMLILTRRVGETIVIGEGTNAVRVTVLGVRGNQVRLGTVAPRDIPINRSEIHDRIERGLPAPKAVANG